MATRQLAALWESRSSATSSVTDTESEPSQPSPPTTATPAGSRSPPGTVGTTCYHKPRPRSPPTVLDAETALSESSDEDEECEEVEVVSASTGLAALPPPPPLSSPYVHAGLTALRHAHALQTPPGTPPLMVLGLERRASADKPPVAPKRAVTPPVVYIDDEVEEEEAAMHGASLRLSKDGGRVLSGTQRRRTRAMGSLGEGGGDDLSRDGRIVADGKERGSGGGDGSATAAEIAARFERIRRAPGSLSGREAEAQLGDGDQRSEERWNVRVRPGCEDGGGVSVEVEIQELRQRCEEVDAEIAELRETLHRQEADLRVLTSKMVERCV